MTTKKIENWKIVPVHGGGVCLWGIVDGKHTQSSNITFGKAGQVMTDTGSVYDLGTRDPGLWPLQLQIKRPEKLRNLKKCGVL